MTTFQGWAPPPGVEVVPPPVHVETRVRVIYSDAHVDEDEYLAHRLNWSAVGDGPRVVAYAVVEEYKPAPEPREWWINLRSETKTVRLHDSWASADEGRRDGFGRIPSDYIGIIHVREVLPAAREVVAWAVVRGDNELTFGNKGLAEEFASEYGGTVVKLTGVMP